MLEQPTSSEIEEIMAEEQEDLSFIRRNVPIRYVLGIMGFFCYAILNILRVSMSIAIVAMVDWKNITSKPSNKPCIYHEHVTRQMSEDGPYTWEPPLQGHILACYFYGLFFTQYFGTLLAEKMNAKYILLIGTILSSLGTVLIPVTATAYGYTILFLQIIKGVGQAFIIPSFSVLMGKWIPKSERPLSMCLIGSGIPFGGFFGIAIAGVISKAESLGWKYVFYIFGGVGLVWCIFWIILIYESPLTHPYITEQELIRILQSQTNIPGKYAVPHKHILKSGPVWAYIAAGFASFWALCIYITVIPLFMATILKFGIELNGVMSSFPLLLEALIYISACILNEKLKEKTSMNPTHLHKIFISVGLAGFAFCMISVTFTACNRWFTVTLLTFGLGMCGMSFASTSVIPIEMSPRYAGTISGITNTFAATSGIIIPTLIGYLTKEKRTINEWAILFYVSSVIAIIGAIIFLVFGSSHIQQWNDPAFFHPSSYEEPVHMRNIQKPSDEDLETQLAQAAGKSEQADTDKLLPESKKDTSGPSTDEPKREVHEPITKPKSKEKEKSEKQASDLKKERPWRTPSFEEIPKHPEPKIVLSLV